MDTTSSIAVVGGLLILGLMAIDLRLPIKSMLVRWQKLRIEERRAARKHRERLELAKAFEQAAAFVIADRAMLSALGEQLDAQGQGPKVRVEDEEDDEDEPERDKRGRFRKKK